MKAKVKKNVSIELSINTFMAFRILVGSMIGNMREILALLSYIDERNIRIPKRVDVYDVSQLLEEMKKIDKSLPLLGDVFSYGDNGE